jgi:hypothetical protein
MNSFQAIIDECERTGRWTIGEPAPRPDFAKLVRMTPAELEAYLLQLGGIAQPAAARTAAKHR